MNVGDNVVDYINNVVGIKSDEKPWEQELKLPIYLRQDKKYSVLTIEGQFLLVIKMESGKFNLSSYQKQMVQLKKHCSYPFVLCFETMTLYQRQALIENKISFVVPGSQLYLPFLGIILKEVYKSVPNKTEKLTAMSQYILLYLIYDSQQQSYSQIELATTMDISAMNVSRSIQELEILELVNRSKQGRISCISLCGNKKETYEKAEPYLQNPVLKKVFVKSEKPYLAFKVAGEEALSEISMMNPPRHKVRAIDKKKFSNIAKEDIVDPNWELDEEIIELEVWKYNPDLFAVNNRVDIISLSLSLKDLEDERINIELMELMEVMEW